MSCEICQRNNCTRSFHSLEEQEKLDNVADEIKERMKNYIKDKLNCSKGEYIDKEFYVRLGEVIDIIDNYC